MASRSIPRIVLFHRMGLTRLYADMAATLVNEVDVIHVAFGAREAAQLASHGINKQVRVFDQEIAGLYHKVEATPPLISEIDALIIEQSGGAFSLNSAIQSDRGFALLDYEEALHLTATYYVFWKHLFEAEDIDFLLHEPCSLMFNFIPAMLLAQRGGAYMYQIMAMGQKGTLNHLTMTGCEFNCPDLLRNLGEIKAGERAVDAVLCQEFLNKFREDFGVFLGSSFDKGPSLSRLAAIAVKSELTKWLQRPQLDRILNNIDYWRVSQNRGLRKLRNVSAYRRIGFDSVKPGERYFFYPLHLEPEAVVLYYAHGIYENQVKIVKNIAGQLPPGVFLYVKDHPHDIGYRDVEDYRKLKAVPNIRLLNPKIAGREVIRGAEGVITLTGSAGFEALMLGKQVYTFGKTFYSAAPRVSYLRHIRDFRDELYERRDEDSSDDSALYPFLTAYLGALRPGFTDYFAGREHKYGVDLEENAKRVAIGLLETVSRL